MEAIQSYPPQPPIQLLTEALSSWVSNPKSGGIILYRNGQYKSNPWLNLQPRWKLFENLSVLLASGNWFTAETLKYPLCNPSLIDPLSKMSTIVTALWKSAFQMKRTHRSYEVLNVEIDIVKIWLNEVSAIGRIFSQLHSENIGTQQIKECVETLENFKLCSLPKKFSILGNRLQFIKDQALDFAKRTLSERLLIPILSETVFDMNNEIKYTLVREIFPKDILESAKNELRLFMNDWKEYLLRGNYELNWSGQERIMLNNFNDAHSYFTSVDFGIDHKLTSPENFHNKITCGNEEQFVFRNKKRLLLIASDILRIAVERFAQEQKLTGKYRLRYQMKAFFNQVYIPLPQSRAINLVLNFHYDYCAFASLVIPLMNDFTEDAPGELLFAKNGYRGECSGNRGDNTRQVKPIKKTILKAPYPQDGGLMFEGMRGKQIHSPIPVIIPSNKKGIFAKVLIQIVCFDEEWMAKTLI